MCRCHFTALRPTRRELQASAEGFTEGHIAAQFTERRCSATIRAIPSTLEWIDTAPHISLHLPLAATTYNLSVTRHLTATVSRPPITGPDVTTADVRDGGDCLVAKQITEVAGTPTAIAPPRRPRPGMVQQAGARGRRCLVAPDATRARTDFCYLTRSPNNMSVRIVRLCLLSATWLARPEGFEPPTPRFVVSCSIQLSFLASVPSSLPL